MTLTISTLTVPTSWQFLVCTSYKRPNACFNCGMFNVTPWRNKSVRLKSQRSCAIKSSDISTIMSIYLKSLVSFENNVCLSWVGVTLAFHRRWTSWSKSVKSQEYCIWLDPCWAKLNIRIFDVMNSFLTYHLNQWINRMIMKGISADEYTNRFGFQFYKIVKFRCIWKCKIHKNAV